MCSITVNRTLLVNKGCIGAGGSDPPVDTQGLASSPLGELSAPLSRVLVPLCTPGRGLLGDPWSQYTSTYKVTAITVRSNPRLRSSVESLDKYWHQKQPPGFKHSKSCARGL